MNKAQKTPKKRSTALYCTVISSQLVMVKMPEHLVRWAEIRREVHRFMKRDFGLQARDVHAIEGFADGIENDTDGGEGAALCERAFGGEPSVLSAFALYSWDDETRSFKLARAASQQ